MAEPGKKKIVSATSAPANAERTDSAEPTWRPTPEAKSQAARFRLIAAAMWVLAIAGEVFAIFWVLKQASVSMVLLIALIVVIGALSIGGSFLWKKANRLDPASRNDTVRFFVQNQLGAIIAVIAFLPLIIAIFADKNLDSKQKGIAGTIGIIVAAAAIFFGIEFNAPAQEDVAVDTGIIVDLTGGNTVYWTKSGKVYHVCEKVPDVNKESKDGTIIKGTIDQAVADGKVRLTQRWKSEAVNYCGYTQEQVDAVAAKHEPASSSDSPASPEPSAATTS